MLANTCNEYLADDLDRADWDVQGFANWAKGEYGAEVNPEWVRSADRREVVRTIEESMEKQIDGTDLAPLDRFLLPDLGARELVQWANNRLGTEFEVDVVEGVTDPTVAADRLLEAAREDLPDHDEQMRSGEFEPLLAWMREHVHQRGSILEPADLIEEATGSPPSPDAFVEYLRDKVERLYGVTA